jgi:hypothetical protein
MPIKGSVTVVIEVVDSKDQHTLIPATGIFDRNIQLMQWSLVAPKGYKFAPKPIVFKDPLPEGCSVFSPPGEEPVRTSDWQCHANVNNILGETDTTTLKYCYDIFYIDPNGNQHKIGEQQVVEIDPDMENQPEP